VSIVTDTPALLTPVEFATKMGWDDAETDAAKRRARRWILRLGIGQYVGRDLYWSPTALRTQAPVLSAALVAKGALDC
jgi:hypothetical protein